MKRQPPKYSSVHGAQSWTEVGAAVSQHRAVRTCDARARRMHRPRVLAQRAALPTVPLSLSLSLFLSLSPSLCPYVHVHAWVCVRVCFFVAVGRMFIFRRATKLQHARYGHHHGRQGRAGHATRATAMRETRQRVFPLARHGVSGKVLRVPVRKPHAEYLPVAQVHRVRHVLAHRNPMHEPFWGAPALPARRRLPPRPKPYAPPVLVRGRRSWAGRARSGSREHGSRRGHWSRIRAAARGCRRRSLDGVAGSAARVGQVPSTPHPRQWRFARRRRRASSGFVSPT